MPSRVRLGFPAARAGAFLASKGEAAAKERHIAVRRRAVSKAADISEIGKG